MTDSPRHDRDDFITHNRRRAELYRWFAGLFADRLDPVLLRAYREGPGRRVLDNLMTRPDLAEGARLMEAALDAPVDDQALSDALSADFGALFEAGRASPRASRWRAAEQAEAPAAATPAGEEGRGAEAGGGRADVLGRMRHLLRHSGLGLRPSLPSNPDHIAVQLDMLAQMAERTLAAWKKAGADAGPAGTPQLVEAWQRQLAFLDNDLLSWLPAFRDACRAYDPDGFYGGAATLLTAYCRRDRAYVARRVDAAD